ncbi:MAG TPA: serine--tRNA ligase [Candidatus Nanoarchaeia archaeon]|nr:serine--tRNA ligase [Candidatus Nanoarchaeia archaeon]
MLDIKFIREHPDAVKESLKRRFKQDRCVLVDKLLDLDKEWRSLKQEGDALRQKRNLLSEQVNRLKKQNKDIAVVLKDLKEVPNDIKKLEVRDGELQAEIKVLLKEIPNLLDDDVPVAQDEEGNKTLRTLGKKPSFKFSLKSHVDILHDLDLADLERAAKVSGARFYYLKNELVELDFAIIRFALDMLKKQGYTLMRTPDLLKKECMEGAAELGDFAETLYKSDDDLFLIGTAEQTLVSLHAGEVVKDLPLKYAGISECFRREAGAHGKDTKGIFRVHEFRKVEQLVYCHPDHARKMQETMIKISEEIFKKLKLHYRVISIASGALNDTAIKKYDLEVWMPVQNAFREMVSCSNCTDYQSHALNIRFQDGEKLVHPYLLNGTAIATPRILVAILENYQQKDGSIKVPSCLQKYVSFKVIKPKKNI